VNGSIPFIDNYTIVPHTTMRATMIVTLFIFILFSDVSGSILFSFHNSSDVEYSREYTLDNKEDIQDDTHQCIPSPLWDKNVDLTGYEIGCDQVQEMIESGMKHVNKGNIREVFLAEYLGRTVAVKTLIDQSERGRHRHWVELVAMDVVRGQPHVVDMLGFCNTTIVTEAYNNDIKAMVKDYTDPLPMKSVISISRDASRGLMSLHEAPGGPIVHFDFKPNQLLINGDSEVKLADFNLSYFMGRKPDGCTCPFNKKHTRRDRSWIKSPEYLSGKPMTEKVDIYRMGMTFVFLLTAGRNDPIGKDGVIEMDYSWHAEYVKLVQDMLQENARLRPSARQVVSRLEKML